jgi:hypothetical protein
VTNSSIWLRRQPFPNIKQSTSCLASNGPSKNHYQPDCTPPVQHLKRCHPHFGDSQVGDTGLWLNGQVCPSHWFSRTPERVAAIHRSTPYALIGNSRRHAQEVPWRQTPVGTCNQPGQRIGSRFTHAPASTAATISGAESVPAAVNYGLWLNGQVRPSHWFSRTPERVAAIHRSTPYALIGNSRRHAREVLGRQNRRTARRYACRAFLFRMFAAKNSTNRRIVLGPASRIIAGTGYLAMADLFLTMASCRKSGTEAAGKRRVQ